MTAADKSTIPSLTPSVEELRFRVDASFDSLVEQLIDLIAIPSVSSLPEHDEDVVASAEYIRDRFAAIGMQAEILTADIEEGTPGKPAVYARSAVIEGAPTVLLYAHHDVQPTGDTERWSLDPFKGEIRGDRLFGRGSSDDGAGIIVHLGALSALGAELGVNVVVYIEGEEEIGSPSFNNFIQKYSERLHSDVIIVADSGNWQVGQPAVTNTLRGNCVANVHVKVLDHAVHSGQFGGPILDAVTIAARLISTFHDAHGDVAVEGLGGRDSADVEWPESEFRESAGLVDSFTLAGTGDLAARLWTKPALNITGFDARAVAQASNTIAPEAEFVISMRTVPDADPEKSMEALVAHIEKNVPFGAEVTITSSQTGPGYSADLDSRAAGYLVEALQAAWGVAPVNKGEGGSIPFISDFQRQFPDAQVLVTGVEDPQTNAHSEDESQSISDLKCAILAEAILLARLAQQA